MLVVEGAVTGSTSRSLSTSIEPGTNGEIVDAFKRAAPSGLGKEAGETLTWSEVEEQQTARVEVQGRNRRAVIRV